MQTNKILNSQGLLAKSQNCLITSKPQSCWTGSLRLLNGMGDINKDNHRLVDCTGAGPAGRTEPSNAHTPVERLWQGCGALPRIPVMWELSACTQPGTASSRTLRHVSH